MYLILDELNLQLTVENDQISNFFCCTVSTVDYHLRLDFGILKVSISECTLSDLILQTAREFDSFLVGLI